MARERYIGKLKKYTDSSFRVIENKTRPAEFEAEIRREAEKRLAEANSGPFDAEVGPFDAGPGDADSGQNKVTKLADFVSFRGIVNDKKLPSSLSRSRSLVYEIAVCNDFEWFGTFTLNSNYKRENLDVFRKTFVEWLKNYNTKYNLEIKYLLVPELHKDGKSWHLHGTLMGLPMEHLRQFQITDKLPTAMLRQIAHGVDLYNWPAYAEKFGYVSLSRIRNHEATARYISKYLTKSFRRGAIEVNKRMFYASKGLKRAEILIEAEVIKDFKPDFENDYVRVKNFDNSDDAMALFVKSGGVV